MKVYSLTFQQNIPLALEEAWNFFSSPHNLQKITPASMQFKIVSPLDEDLKMYAGMLIRYKVTPLPGFTTDWMTEITHVDSMKYFIDEQRFGPYALWHHQHHFEAAPNGTLMKDILYYAIPYGIIGRVVNNLLVEKRVRKIFEYRKNKITELFGK